MTSTTVRVVAFDVMDTLLDDPFREALLAATGLDPERFFELRDPGLYPAFERGEIDEPTYWRRHAEQGIGVDPHVFHAVRRDRIRWLPGMPELLEELDGVVERAAASNYPIWIEELTERFLSGRIDRVIASCHLGVRKPDEAFYVELLARLGCRPQEVLFVDDRERNVDGAREVGLRAHRFRGVVALRRWLAAEGVAVSAAGPLPPPDPTGA